MPTHTHQWHYYHGLLGYESLVCSVCRKDINDFRASFGETGPDLLAALEALLAEHDGPGAKPAAITWDRAREATRKARELAGLTL